MPVATFVLALATSMPHAVDFESCRWKGTTPAGRCAVIELPEDYGKPDGRKLPIHVAVLPARSGKPTKDAVVYFTGGPGQPTIEFFADYTAGDSPVGENRDVVFVDQRGTGRSHPLTCLLFDAKNPAPVLAHWAPPDAVERCTKSLAKTHDLSQYGYANFARDLERIRVALGYESFNLSGGSYGTRAAQVYARMYPQSTRTLFLHSLVPIDVAFPAPFAEATDAELEKMFEACEADEACKAKYPTLRDDFAAMVATLKAGEAAIDLAKVEGVEATGTAKITHGRAAEWIRSRLYGPKLAVTLPRAIHAAANGDWEPVAEGIVAYAKTGDTAFSWALLFAITCNEDLAFLDLDAVARASKDTLLGDFRVREQAATCRHVPKVELPAGYRDPMKTDIPTVFVAGTNDSATPVELAKNAARGYSNSVVLVRENRGHTDWEDCLAGLYARFVETASVEGIDDAGCEPATWPAFE